MSQQEIMDLLEANPDKWFTPKEIREKLDISSGAIGRNLLRLRADHNIDHKPKTELLIGVKLYKHKSLEQSLSQ